MYFFQRLPRYFYSSVLIYFFSSVFAINTVQAGNGEIHIEPTPKWVEYRTLSSVDEIPVDEIRDGVFYRLVDDQVKVSDSGKRTSYTRYIESVINQTGVESSSQINLEFDPSYQKLVLNTLFLTRNGHRIDKLQTAKISLLNSENELDDQIYHGYLTMNILVDDVREGDTIDYSYTRYGMNPVYKGIFSYARSLNWSVPVHDQYLRILWGKSKLLNVKTRNIEPIIQQNKSGGYTEYQIHMHDADTISEPSQTPDWYSPYGSVYFSEVESWEDVVAWAKPLYNFKSIDPDVIQIANNIAQQYSDPADQIVGALSYVQEHIRYVALQMGINSHLPTPANETLALRYGDCKDKAVLLISILTALGIDSYPALVDTEQTKLLIEKPPALNLFDHVLVTLLHDQQRIWLDPTLRFQNGSLLNLFQPDYGYALILKSGQNNLTSMSQERKNSYTHISEQYFIPQDVNKAVTLAVVSDYLGDKALNKYSQIEQEGKNKLSKDYEIYYQRTYPNLITTADIDVANNKSTGIVTLTEKYSIDNFWSKKDENYEVDFYPTDIRNAVFEPKQTNRDAPLHLTYPNNINNQIQVKFEEDGWDFKSVEFIEDNDFFFFKENVSFKNKTLTLNYEYKAKTDHIPADQIDSYVASRKRLRAKAHYGLMKYGENEDVAVSEDNASTYPLWIEITVLFYLIGFGVIIVGWRLESRTRPTFTEVNFFPISLPKFLTISITTFGMYNAYWMYRNWQAIQLKQEAQMMPIARGIFSTFWFYPLFNQLKEDSIERFSKNKVMATFFAITFTLVYFVISAISQSAEQYVVTELSILLPLLFIPLVSYINSVNIDDLEAYNYNSKWHIRHTIAVLMFIPLLGFTLVSDSSLLPSDAVVTQADIMTSDMTFLHRKKIVPPDEKINYFYSDAFLSIRDDGNGFTDKRIFSYWLDEKDQFQSEIVAFEKVKDIKVEYTEDPDSNTIITIIRSDDSDFMLFVSAVDAGDKLFVNKLKEQWKKQS